MAIMCVCVWGGGDMASTLKQNSQNRQSTWTLKPRRGFKFFNKLTLKKKKTISPGIKAQG